MATTFVKRVIAAAATRTSAAAPQVTGGWIRFASTAL